jgi:hypothetical protein
MATKELTITVTATRKWWFPVALWVARVIYRIRPSATEAVIAFLIKRAFNYQYRTA